MIAGSSWCDNCNEDRHHWSWEYWSNAQGDAGERRRHEITLADNAGQGDVHVDADTGENLVAFVHTQDAIVNALPFYLNKTVATACTEARRSYFDFSEDIESARFVSDLAREFKEIVFVPQCGLALGAINVIGVR
jgi:saccharopine dehydrogenase-like NADP-dependent oxidoreductase